MISTYLQPLIEELKQLWAGVETYDVVRKENFNLRATLMWTINDFPAYANFRLEYQGSLCVPLLCCTNMFAMVIQWEEVLLHGASSVVTEKS